MVDNIAHIHLLNFAPSELPAKLKMKSDEKEGFFFTCLDLMKMNKITSSYSSSQLCTIRITSKVEDEIR
ncbi:unnamed protein product [Trifolium pratense]|uniref:Uncharacterized protein n=1 Tax=Trifolium pratense TaxID=57577 RepID=A0ACB0IBU0_TRIPR|nr:unnamed protein product [Trifolium pratense]